MKYYVFLGYRSDSSPCYRNTTVKRSLCGFYFDTTKLYKIQLWRAKLFKFNLYCLFLLYKSTWTGLVTLWFIKSAVTEARMFWVFYSHKKKVSHKILTKTAALEKYCYCLQKHEQMDCGFVKNEIMKIKWGKKKHQNTHTQKNPKKPPPPNQNQKTNSNGKQTIAKQNKCICIMPWSLFSRQKHWQTSKWKKFQTENSIAKFGEFKFQQQESQTQSKQGNELGRGKEWDISQLLVSQITSVSYFH